MGLETATYINGLVDTNPTSSDNANQGDNHIRLLKSTIKNTFPNVTGAVTVSHSDLNTVTGKLDKAGGTMTGALTGTSATYSGTVTAAGFSGPVTGNVTGNASTATALQTARLINGTSFNGTANISFTTDATAEGTTNLYYTNARARAAVSATGTGLSYDSSTGVFTFTPPTTDGVAEGSTNLYFTNARVRSAISASGSLAYDSATGVVSFTDAVTSVAGKTGAVSLTTSDVSGLDTALAGKLSTSGGSLSGNLSVTGTITATGDITAFSDARLKTNVETLGNALHKVKSLRGVSYVSKLDANEHIGVIAQEVERVLPQVVKTHSDSLKSVAYGNLVGVLIEAIKELEARVAELENR